MNRRQPSGRGFSALVGSSPSIPTTRNDRTPLYQLGGQAANAYDDEDVPENSIQSKTANRVVDLTRYVTILGVLLALLILSYIITTTLCSTGIICLTNGDLGASDVVGLLDDDGAVVGEADDDDGITLDVPCLECDGNTLVAQNISTNTLFSESAFFLNTTNNEYFNIFEYLETINGTGGGGSTPPPVANNLTCAQCSGDTLIVQNINVTESADLTNVILYGNTTITNVTDGDMLVVNIPAWFYSEVEFHNSTIANELIVDTIMLLNTTSSMYIDVFESLDNLTSMQNMIKEFINDLTLDNCTVIQVCGPGGSVLDALVEAGALGPSETNPVGVEFCPGLYVVENDAGPIQVPAFVHLYARVPGSVTLTPSSAAFFIFDLNGETTLKGFNFDNGVSYLGQSNQTGSVTTIRDCSMRMGNNFFTSVGGLADGYLFVFDSINVRLTSGSSSLAFDMGPTDYARLYFNDVSVEHDSLAALGRGIRLPSNVTTFISSVAFLNLDVGVSMQDVQLDFSMHDVFARNITTAVLRVDSYSGDTIPSMRVHGIDSDETVSREIVISSTTSDTLLYQFGGVHYYDSEEGAKPNAIEAVEIDVHLEGIENTNLRVLTDLTVGVPEKPHSSFLGGGPITARNLLVYFQAGANPPVRVDQLMSMGAAQAMSPVANSAVYVALNTLHPTSVFPLPHYGVVLHVQSAVSMAPSDVVPEYWDGTAWRRFNIMSYRHTSNYQSLAQRVLVDTGIIAVNYDYRLITGFTPNPQGPMSLSFGPWTPSDPVGFGTNLLWVRFRTDTSTVSAATISYVEHLPNSVQIKDTGDIVYHGLHRRKQQIKLYENQVLMASDTISMTALMPTDADTSCPLLFEVYFSTDVGGDYNMTVNFQPLDVPHPIDNADFLDVTSPEAQSETLAATTASGTVLNLDYQEFTAADMVKYNGVLPLTMMRFELTMNAVVGSPVSEIYIALVQVIYVKHMENTGLSFV